MIASVTSLLALSVLGHALPQGSSSDPSAAAGYLFAAFKGDVPHVFFLTAPASSPSTFQALNGGQATLIPTTGTGGARDPYIFRAEDKSKYIVLATDLDIGKTNWGAAQATGSRSIYVWESSVDGVSWSKERLVELMPPTAGYLRPTPLAHNLPKHHRINTNSPTKVWAPSATWDVQTSSYAIFWSSVLFSEFDTAHTGPSQGPYIFYSHTSDFQTFTSPQRWNPDITATVIDQEIQYLGGESYVRYLSDTNEVRRVVLERSDNGLFGDWKRIGVPVDQVREGPASYRDVLDPEKYYLLEDNYSGAGYECYYTRDFSVPYTPCEPSLTPEGLRHGAVTQVDFTSYVALQRNVTG